MNIEQLYEKATGYAPFPYQSAFANAPAIPDVLAVPTGAGKTATVVLGWLWRRRFAEAPIREHTPRRLVFCLPMRTLVDQTEVVTRDWLTRLGLKDDVTVHSLQGGAVDQAWDDAPDREVVLIGTQDQLLSRALNRGYAMSRFRWPVHFAWLHNDALWVMDEVQLMGVGVSTAAQLQGLREALGTGRPTHTVWMSATLAPSRMATVDFARPLTRMGLEDADELHEVLQKRLIARKPLTRAATAFDKRGAKALADEVLGAHKAGTLTLVVVNRVARAQALAESLRKRAPTVTVRLVHGRFRPSDRKAMEKGVLERGFDGILVATQAVEAGVDISARVLFTELAPWSSLVQRFGRCNRGGEIDDAEVRWIDLPNDEAAPYEEADLTTARERLGPVTDVGPRALPTFADDTGPTLPVLRRRDLLDLFDTSTDLAGHDLDISRFVRTSDADRDVQIAWRSWTGDEPPDDAPAPRREELCRVAVWAAEKLLKGESAWRWDSLEGHWAKVDRLYPGLVLLVQRDIGGYADDQGFTGDAKHKPTVTAVTGDTPDHDESDVLTQGADRYVTLTEHSKDAAEELHGLATSIGGPQPWELLERAARAHDLGKAHPAFQAMLTSALPANDARRSQGPWAKSDGVGGGRNPRRHFRHELASALVRLAAGADDLEVYVVAAHHGKLRLALRARPGEIEPVGRRFALGVWDGDEVPATDLGDGMKTAPATLTLAVMELGDGPSGPSWSARMLALRDRYGPFRLGYWEALVRVADWRATRRHIARLGGQHD